MAGRKRRVQPKFFLFLVIVAALVGGVIFVAGKLGKDQAAGAEASPTPSAAEPSATSTPAPPLPDGLTVNVSAAADPTLLGFSSEINSQGDIVESYTRESPVSFPDKNAYTNVAGLLTFGGNNYRNTFSYGTATVNEKLLSKKWEQSIGGIDAWMGTGWTGQPLIVQWPDSVRPWLGVEEAYKTKEGFTEVIYPAMDGKIYFYELETGAKTRNPISVGVVMKGTPCLDPNGYPVLYVGQSIQTTNDKGLNVSYIHAYSLITNEELARFGGHDYFSHREWQAYDGSPIITDDTLVFAGENGVLYSSKLNTSFDAATGTLAIAPERLVKYRYTGSGYSDTDAAGSRWYGVESSVSGFRNYVYFTDNGGRLQCVDLNTMKLQFVADVGDDADATVVIDERYEENTVYLYTASQVSTGHATLGDQYGYTYHRCFNGLTGELVWEQKWVASTGADNSSGGTLATPHVGRGNIENLVIYAVDQTALTGGIVQAAATATPEVTDTPNPEATQEQPAGATDGYTLGGRIVAYNKKNGDLIWTIESGADYWSSPVVVYDAFGKAFLVQCDRQGNVKLYDALTSSELFTLDLGSRIDSTPAAFDSLFVVGTRGKGGSGDTAKIICFKIN